MAILGCNGSRDTLLTKIIRNSPGYLVESSSLRRPICRHLVLCVVLDDALTYIMRTSYKKYSHCRILDLLTSHPNKDQTTVWNAVRNKLNREPPNRSEALSKKPSLINGAITLKRDPTNAPQDR
jgi:hypothetical protein